MDAPGRLNAAALPGRPPTLGPYRLLRRIGEGGMGVVHLATAPDGSRVALKVLRPYVVADAGGRERLIREVAALQRVRSPRVAPLLAADAWGDTPYVVTRFVPGLSLSEFVAEYGPLVGDRLLRVGRGLAEALAAVHAVGVVHRDVKPSNVLLEGDDPVLIDFGLARAADDVTVTVGGWMLGTPAYLTPELVDGADPEPAGDVHAWASTLAYACTGRSPFGGGHQSVVLDRVRRNAHDLEGVPLDLRGMLERCLATDPRSRPPAPVLAGWLGGSSPVAERTTLSVPAAPVAPDAWVQPQQPPPTRIGPAPAPPWQPPRRLLGHRLLRLLVGVLGVLVCAASFAAAPYAAALAWWLAVTGIVTFRRVGDQRRRRRQLRGRAGVSDQLVAAAAAPWHVVAALLRATWLVGSGVLAAGLVAALLQLFGFDPERSLWVGAAVFLAVLWLGPGGRWLHRPAIVFVDTLARPDLVGIALVWLLAALAAGSVGVVEAYDPLWWPADSPPL